MISRLTKVQLVIFVIVTLLGGAFVGGRYAQIDRLFIDRTYPVSAQFSDSGGIFAGAQVTYRGIEVGTVGKLEFKDDGVNARLDIENNAPDIPADVLAVVANKSAIGEQFVDLQPRSNKSPFLKDGSEITLQNTRIPIDTTTLLVDFDRFVGSVNTESLATVVNELGQAFEGTGGDLAKILDNSSAFIDTATENIDVTRSLIRNSDSVLQTQIDKQGQLATFSENLALFSETFADADPDFRRLLDNGAGSAKRLRQVVDENADDLTKVFDNLVVSNRPVAENIVGLQAILVLYPYLLQGSFSVVDDSTEEGEYDATFGLVTTLDPKPCTFVEDGGEASGYRERLVPEDIERREFNTDAFCRIEDKVAREPSKTELNGKKALNRAAADSGASGSLPPVTGKDSWQWLLLGPTVQ